MGVRINPDTKTVVIKKVVGLARELDPLEEIRSLLRDEGKGDVKRESLGEKEVDGRQAVGWRVSGPGLHQPGATVVIWGDPETGLPIRIESYSALEGVKSTLSDFVFNVDLDELLFSAEPPAGYTVQTVEVDASQPTEEDLIALLRQYSTLMNGAFPESLDMNCLVRTLGTRIRIETMLPEDKRPSDELLREITEAETDEEITKLIEAEFWKNENQAQAERLRQMRNAEPDKGQEKVDVAKEARQKAMEVFDAKWTGVYLPIMRGLGFVAELPVESDVHYAGQGVSLDEPGTPIFWYRVKDATKYRVIWADLSVGEVDRPPKVLGAKLVPAVREPKE